MGESPQPSFTFSVVPSTEADEAFRFHIKIAESDDHILPRKRRDLRRYAKNNFLVGARRNDTGKFVGLCYLKRDEEDKSYELGGLTVPKALQNSGIGTLLVQFTLAHGLVHYDIWRNRDVVIAHVHTANAAPRRLMESLSFKYLETKHYSGKDFPGLKQNENGEVVGDVFEFPRDAMQSLAVWFTSKFTGGLRNGSPIHFVLGLGTFDDLLDDLRDIANGLD